LRQKIAGIEPKPVPPIVKLARVKVEQKLPVVISIGEVQTLLKLIEKRSMHCYFTEVYHLGLRLNKASHLQISDIKRSTVAKQLLLTPWA
jgi:integrase